MNELEQFWAQQLTAAADRARTEGRHQAADYLALKASNDLLRSTAVEWLFKAAVEIADEQERTMSGITIEREYPHQFSHNGSNMVGSVIRFSRGLRSMELEAGWARTPKDGFMKGGALAVARVLHFGMPARNELLLLSRLGDLPKWRIAKDDRTSAEFGLDDLKRHFTIFVGQHG